MNALGTYEGLDDGRTDEAFERTARKLADRPFEPTPTPVVATFLLAVFFALGAEGPAETQPAWLVALEGILTAVSFALVTWSYVADRRLTPALRERIIELRTQRAARDPRHLRFRYTLAIALITLTVAWACGWAASHAPAATLRERAAAMDKGCRTGRADAMALPASERQGRA